MMTMAPLKTGLLFVPEINLLLQERKYPELKALLKELSYADIEEGWDAFEPEAQVILFKLLDVRKSILLFEELRRHQQGALLSMIEDSMVSQMTEQLSPNDVAHLFRKLSPRYVKKMSRLLKREEAVKRLEQGQSYPPNSAGRLMHTELVRLTRNMTISQAMAAISTMRRSELQGDSLLSNLYITDESGVLVGEVPLQDLVIVSNRDLTLSQFIKPALFKQIMATADQEEASRIFSKYRLISAPVVDDKSLLIGVILVDDIMDVISTENTEDIAKMAGVTLESFSAQTVLRQAKTRLPWLFVTLLGGLLVSHVVTSFGDVLAKMVALASFMPLISGMGGNIGSQTATILVRNLALGQVTIFNQRKAVLLEVGVGTLIGTAYGALLTIVAYVLFPAFRHTAFPYVIGTGMFCSMVIASTIGAIGPLLLTKLKIDPATATGPMITTTTDLISLSIYLTLGTIFLL